MSNNIGGCVGERVVRNIDMVAAGVEGVSRALRAMYFESDYQKEGNRMVDDARMIGGLLSCLHILSNVAVHDADELREILKIEE